MEDFMYSSIIFFTTFYVISRKFGLIFGQCGGGGGGGGAVVVSNRVDPTTAAHFPRLFNGV